MKKEVQGSIMSFMNKKIQSQEKQKQVDSNLSKSQDQQSHSHDERHQPKKPPTLYNVEFYRNERVSQPSGDYLKNIHKNWANNFNLLQRHHGFIQWLFPNSFSSRFNSRSFALTAQQQKIFRSDLKIAQNYILSYQMMLNFYGMKLKSKQTGQITRARTVNHKERYHETLLTSFHNHMRITRILCSLNMVGFGRYAKQLSFFLYQEIHAANGDLRPLAKYNVDKDWKEYIGYVETWEDLNVFLKQYQKSKEEYQQKNNQKILKQEKSREKIEETKQEHKKSQKKQETHPNKQNKDK